MPRPRFSEMLIERRRQLGLTIEQASSVLKLKVQVLVAFEEGDFGSIPKSGYAQGMLSSYARYLGLNPRQIVDQFQEDLYEYTNGVSSHDLRRRARASRGSSSDPTYEVPLRTPSNLPQPSHLLPDNPILGDTGEFDTTSSVRSRGQMLRSAAYASRSRDGSYNYDRSRERRSYTHYDSGNRGMRDQLPESTSRSSRRMYTDTVVRRDVATRQYADDLRYDDNATPYQPASTRQGRSSSRNIAPAERPRVQRRRSDVGRRQLRSRDERRAPQRSGIVGMLHEYFSDSSRAIITVLVGLVVILILIIMLSVRACTSPAPTTNRSVSVQTVSPSTDDEENDDQTSQNTDTNSDDASNSNASQNTSSKSNESVEEVNVTVTVADGSVTWIEITNGGQSEIAETITGPWEATYSVSGSMTIQVSDTSAVTVTSNGKNVSFDSRASGIGTAVIQGPSKTDNASSQNDSSDGETTNTTSDENTNE